MKTIELVDYLDNLLNINQIDDSSLNGLQVGNSGKIKKIAYSVDASLETFEKACELDVNFLFVHHGIFWSKPVSITGNLYRRIKILIDNDIALYAAHLPLDIHPKFGNNSQIQDVLKWKIKDDFGLYHGVPIGKIIEFKNNRNIKDLADEIESKLGCDPVVWDFGPDRIRKAAYVSGDGISMLDQAIDAGVDLYITGEPSHSAFWQAKEAGINIIFAGHYITETLGVKAVGEEIKRNFGIETIFINLPTGY